MINDICFLNFHSVLNFIFSGLSELDYEREGRRWGVKPFSKNNNNKNAHLEGSQDMLNSKRVLEKMLRRFKCKWTQNIIIKFPLNLPEFGVKEKIKLRENTLEVSGKCQVLRKIDF